MKIYNCVTLLFLFFISCQNQSAQNQTSVNKTQSALQGTWKLLQGMTIEKGDTTVTDYRKDKEFIKIINDSHFAFLSHSIDKKDTSAAAFIAGGGKYTLADSTYTEHLDYCSDRQWEGNSFPFTITINGDTLIQKGIEKVDSIGVDRMNTETYVRLKN